MVPGPNCDMMCALCQTRPFQTINIEVHHSTTPPAPITFYSAGLDVKQGNHFSLGCLSEAKLTCLIVSYKISWLTVNIRCDDWTASYHLHHLRGLNEGRSASVTIICLCKPRWLAGLYYYRERDTHLSPISGAGPSPDLSMLYLSNEERSEESDRELR